MTGKNFQKIKIPDSPGVYFFLGSKKEILYIGKATSLKNRVKSYFSIDIRDKRSELIEKMVKDAKTVEWTVTDSVLEALILEVNLIRTHKPRCNTVSKDDKSYNHLIITDEEFPRVLVVRGKDLKLTPEVRPLTKTKSNCRGNCRGRTSDVFDVIYKSVKVKYHFGPFTSAGLFKEALKIIRKLFQFYDTKVPIGKEKSKMARGKIDFNKQIGLYPETLSKKEYERTIRHIKLFFEGKKKQVIKELKTEMTRLAKQENFEEAEILKKKIFALEHIQDIALIKIEKKVYRDERTVRIEAYDIAHLGGKDMVGVMTVVEGGEPKKSEYRKFKITSVNRSNDTGALKEVLSRRLAHPEWSLPQIIVVDGGTAQKNAAEYVLKKAGVLIPVVAVVKDDRHRPVRVIASRKLREQYENNILLANAESHRFAIAFHREKSRKGLTK